MPYPQNTPITVTTSPTLLCRELPNRKWLTLSNDGSVTVYVGAEDVSTASYVWKIEAGDIAQFEDAQDQISQIGLYGCVESGTAPVSVGEVRD